jgi:DNA-binding NtrC family response regulator
VSTNSSDGSEQQSGAVIFATPQTLHIPVGTTVAEAQKLLILATLKHCGNHKTMAAAMLGISLKTLYNRLNAYRLRKP